MDLNEMHGRISAGQLTDETELYVEGVQATFQVMKETYAGFADALLKVSKTVIFYRASTASAGALKTVLFIAVCLSIRGCRSRMPCLSIGPFKTITSATPAAKRAWPPCTSCSS